MRRLALALAPVLTAGVLGAPPAAAADPRRIRIETVQIAAGLLQPVAMAASPDASGRLFVVERAGRIRVLRDGQLSPLPFLDITPQVSTLGERGLLGLAFAAHFASSGVYYVAYADHAGALHVSRFRATPGHDLTVPLEEKVLTVAHPTYTNHYGGQIGFGPDGFLYVGTGDGGGGGDPDGNAQDLGSLLGKVLRIDPSRSCGGLAYCIPPGNPYARSATAKREIWLSGLRNPWRFSFDRRDRSLWIADVGQNAWEEIDRLPHGYGGRNLGWDCREGRADTVAAFGGPYCAGKRFWAPLWQYGRSGGCAVIGGYVYRGSRQKSLLDGVYLYGDYCSGRIWGLGKDSRGRWVNAELHPDAGNLLTFGEDRAGEVYAATTTGFLYRLDAVRR